MTKQRQEASDEATLTAEDFFSGGDEPLNRLEIPELRKGGRPGVVFLKQLTAGELMEFKTAPADSQDEANLKLVAGAVCDASGKQIFSSEADLKKLPMKAVNRIAKAVMDDFTSKSDAVGNESSGATGTDSPTA